MHGLQAATDEVRRPVGAPAKGAGAARCVAYEARGYKQAGQTAAQIEPKSRCLARIVKYGQDRCIRMATSSGRRPTTQLGPSLPHQCVTCLF